MKGFGKGGHTVLIVDNPGKGKKEVMTLGFNRDMPRNEGFGEKNFQSTLNLQKVNVSFSLE